MPYFTINHFLSISIFDLVLLSKEAFLNKKPLLKSTLHHVCTSSYSIKGTGYRKAHKIYLNKKYWALLEALALLGVNFDRNFN